STAELLAPNELASFAALFREGAPPRVTTPVIEVDPASPPQPTVIGSTEAEDDVENAPVPKLDYGSLTGSIQIDHKRTAGVFGLVTLEPIGVAWKPRTPKPHVIEQRDR